MNQLKSYIRKIAEKWIVDLILMLVIVSILMTFYIIFNSRSGIGTITKVENDWIINYDPIWNTGFLVSNPEYFSETLILKNNGSEVFYIFLWKDLVLPYIGIYSVWVICLELPNVYIIKQFILYSSLVLIGILISIFLYIKRNRYGYIVKLFN